MYVPDSKTLRGLSVSSAQCFGMPHANAHYSGKGVRTNHLSCDAMCSVCGMMATNSHHVPPVGMGGRNATFTLHGHVLRPALIALCGSGTTGCHGMIHSGLLRVEWSWDDDAYAEAWWSGELLEELEPHDQRLYGLGKWVFTFRSGRVVSTYRG